MENIKKLLKDLCLKNKKECSISTHSQTIRVDQPCGGEEVTYFKDSTTNHNKAFIFIESFTTPPCFITLIMETRDGQRIEEEIRPPAPQVTTFVHKSFQVENLQRVSVRCEDGVEGSRCTANLTITKTFCICCQKEKSWKKNIENFLNSKIGIGEKCFINQNEQRMSFSQPCNASRVDYFKDFTNNHNKIMITVSLTPRGGCTATVFITTGNNTVIERQIPSNSTRSFQAEDVKNIAIACSGDPGEVCGGSINIQKTFCICCKKEASKDDRTN